MHPELPPHDIAYVSATFRRLTADELSAAAAGLAARASYVLPDGQAMGTAQPDPDLAGVADQAELRDQFVARWIAAGGDPLAVDPEFEAWLDGDFGVCLRAPAPEPILAKAGLAQAITALITHPRPDQDWWRATLRCAVEAFDRLVLPFASVDAARFGRATSRTRLVDTVRERWPEVFASADR